MLSWLLRLPVSCTIYVVSPSKTRSFKTSEMLVQPKSESTTLLLLDRFLTSVPFSWSNFQVWDERKLPLLQFIQFPLNFNRSCGLILSLQSRQLKIQFSQTFDCIELQLGTTRMQQRQLLPPPPLKKKAKSIKEEEALFGLNVSLGQSDLLQEKIIFTLV